jgi:hypothetical protein
MAITTVRTRTAHRATAMGRAAITGTAAEARAIPAFLAKT